MISENPELVGKTIARAYEIQDKFIDEMRIDFTDGTTMIIDVDTSQDIGYYNYKLEKTEGNEDGI